MKRNSLRKRVAGALFAAAAPLFPLSLAAQTGGAYSFLDIPASVRAFGLGGVNVALVEDDVGMAFQNPALLGGESDRQLSLGYMHYAGGSNFASATFGKSAGLRGAWAAGIRYLGHGDFEGYDQNGTYTGDFSANDVVGEGTYSHDITPRLRGGINVKAIYSAYEGYTAFALGADLGINYYDEERDLSLSAVLMNMGGQIKRFEDRYERLPFDIRLGWMQGIGHSGFSVSVTAWDLTHWSVPVFRHADGETETVMTDNFVRKFFRHIIPAVQYRPDERFYIEGAYNYKTRSDMEGYRRNILSGITLGAGMGVGTFKVGVAYAMPHRSASSFMLSVAMTL